MGNSKVKVAMVYLAHMAGNFQSVQLVPDIHELLLSPNPDIACETYLFEPASHETTLGHLIAVAETKNPLGKDLLDLVINAIQREYYRSPSRGMVRSFESALHQANLVLNDTVEQGVRDWMQYFHVAIGVLNQTMLHISIAGQAYVFIVRGSRVTEVSYGLDHPITSPLRCFSQVASGTVTAQDILFFGTYQFAEAFPADILQKIGRERSASQVGLALKDHYTRLGSALPLAVTTLSLLPQSSVPEAEDTKPLRAKEAPFPHSPLPRKPLVLHSPWYSRFFQAVYQITRILLRLIRQKLWPHIKKGSQTSGRVLWSTSKNAWMGVHALATKNAPADPMVSREPLPSFTQRLRSLPRLLLHLPRRLGNYLWLLPRISKVFVGITLVLAVAFVVSLLLLRNKRIEDSKIQRASELLHQATTKEQAANNLLIYGDRQQALHLLDEADAIAVELRAMNVYEPEVTTLQAKIQESRDKTQRIWRAKPNALRTVGEFSSIAKGEQVRQLFLIAQTFFTFNPKTNAILALNSDGKAQAATTTTRERGFISRGIAHEADKTIILATDEPGIAIFDTTAASLEDQEITLPPKIDITAMATYSNRLYVLDAAVRMIYSYNKTLRGYSGGTPWLSDPHQLQGTLTDIAVDGFIYTLATNGTIQKFYKGNSEAFSVEPITPPIEQATRLIASSDFKNMYILDQKTGRIIILNKKGQLQQQLYVSDDTPVLDIAIAPDETKAYALVGMKVVEIPLSQ